MIKYAKEVHGRRQFIPRRGQVVAVCKIKYKANTVLEESNFKPKKICELGENTYYELM